MYQQPNAPQPPFPSPQLRPVDPSAREARRIGKEISRRGLGMGLALIGMLVCSYLFSSGMGALLQQMGFSDYRRYAKEFSYLSPVVYYLQYAVIYLGMVIIPFAVLAICFRMKSVEFLPFRRRTGAKVTAGYIVIGCSASVLLNFMAAYFLDALSLVGLKPAVNAAPYPEGDPLALALYGVVIAVLPAFAEEFAFRGVVLGLLRPYGEVFAVAGSALLFGIMHGNVVQIPFALAGGLVLGFIAVRTGSLWPSVCIHFLNNLLSYLQEVFSHTLPEGAYLAYIYSLYMLLAVALILGVFWFCRKDPSLFQLQGEEDALLTNSQKFTQLVTNPGMILAFILIGIQVLVQLGYEFSFL